MSNFHLLPMSETVVATGHSGSSSFVSLKSSPYIVLFLHIIFYFNLIVRKKQ